MAETSTNSAEFQLHHTKNRIVAVDISRIMAALFIMYEHIQVWDMNASATNLLWGFMGRTIGTYSCIFFVFAGYFACRNITWKKGLDNAFWCFAPYVLWNVIALGMAYISHGQLPEVQGCTTFWEKLWAYTGLSGLPPIDGPLWFMRDLAILFLISPVLYRLSTWLFPLFLCLSLYSGYAGLFGHDHAMVQVCSLYSVGFFSLGCFLRKLSKETQQKLLRFYSTPLLVVYFVIIFSEAFLSLTGHESILQSSLCDIPYISTTVSLWILYQLARFIEEKLPFMVPFALRFAPVTFLTFAVHSIIYKNLLPPCIINTNWMICLPVLVFVILTGFFMFLKRYCRPLLHLVAHYKLRPDDLAPAAKKEA